MCVQLFKDVFPSRVLASIFELSSKLAEIVTTETVTTETHGKVSVGDMIISVVTKLNVYLSILSK